MKNRQLLWAAILLFATTFLQGQNKEVLPRGLSAQEQANLSNHVIQSPESSITDPPSVQVRTMAEWEELQAVVITWTGGSGLTNILREIVRYAKEEVEVIIVCSNAAVVKNSLGGVGIDWTTNVTFIEDEFNSIWVRDYGPNSVYANDVGALYFIDWIYNRPRPDDDDVPSVIGDHLAVPVYSPAIAPNDLVHTGGNFMADGMGTGFSSKLVLNENDAPNQWGTSDHSEAEIDTIIKNYMGIDRYIKMEELIYDPIDHIDMHIKLVDEETLIVGEYPPGRADGPQIEANLQYVLNNFTTPFGNPYHVVRVPMPPDFGGNFPDDPFPNQGDYRTYANAIILNKTILVPTYEEVYDTVALRIWQEAMPGYNIQGINCNSIIGLNGAIHCITKEVGHHDPLLINLPRIREGCVSATTNIEAIIKHQSGIAGATLFYTTDLNAGYASIPMSSSSENKWTAQIPAQNEETEMYYYIQADANSGKQIVRPLVAPTGYFHYEIKNCVVSSEDVLLNELQLEEIFPNPASAITCVPVTVKSKTKVTLSVTDVLGRNVETLFEGMMPVGENKYFIHAQNYEAGTYFVSLKTDEHQIIRKLIVQ